jgi:hypothetical protein
VSRYTKIVEALGDDGAGIQKSRQSDFKALESSSYTGGASESDRTAFCRGLATEWLASKKQGTNFWEGLDPTESTGLLSGTKLSDQARQVHNLYKEIRQIDGIGWTACIDRLKEIGVDVNTDEDKKSDGKFGNWDGVIAQQVLTSKSRYYFLSVRREGGSHTTAIHRDYALIGKSSVTSFYDPNLGEFRLKNRAGLKTLISSISTIGYEDKYNKNWHLQAYSG